MAIDDDLQSITGVWLQGSFQTDFTKVLEKLHEYQTLKEEPWKGIVNAVRVLFGGVAYSNTQLIPIAPEHVLQGGQEPPIQEQQLERIAQLLSIDLRNYNFLNKLLGFGAKDEKLSTMLEGVDQRFGVNAEVLQDEDFIKKCCELITMDGKRTVVEVNSAGVPIKKLPEPQDGDGIDRKVADAIVTDDGDSKLYLKLDLSEWLYINNPDILHVVIESPKSLNGYYPLGRTTVWLPASAQVQHIRSKTAKTFLRGKIAERLRIEDIEANLAGFVNTIFDTDSEQAYSTAAGPC